MWSSWQEMKTMLNSFIIICGKSESLPCFVHLEENWTNPGKWTGERNSAAAGRWVV